LHHAISPFSDIHNDNFFKPIMAFKSEDKEMYPIFVFAKRCWSIHPKVVIDLASMHTADREKPLPRKLCRFTSSLRSVHALLLQHLFSEFFQLMVLHGPASETVRIQRRQKSWLKSTDFTKLKKVTSRIYQARNQLGTPGGTKNFLNYVQYF